jgi:molecular chaperone HtpG
LIKKEETTISKLSEEEQTNLKTVLETIVPKQTYSVQLEALDSNSAPFIITQPEFMRRMKEMSQRRWRNVRWATCQKCTI